MKAPCIWEQKQTYYSVKCNDWANHPKQKDKLCFCVAAKCHWLSCTVGQKTETSGRVHNVTASMKT